MPEILATANKYNQRNMKTKPEEDEDHGIGPDTGEVSTGDIPGALDSRDDALEGGDWLSAISSDEGNRETPRLFDDLGDEELDRGALEAFEELPHTQADIVSFALREIEGRGRRTNGKIDRYITSEDFEAGAERNAFLLIYGYALNLLEPRTRKQQFEAIGFYFLAAADHGLLLDDAAQAISAEVRTDVIRLRMVYELWLRFIQIPPLSMWSVPVPRLVTAGASMYAGTEGECLVSEIWRQPGVEMAEAISCAINLYESIYDKQSSRERMAVALTSLETNNHLVSARELGADRRYLWVTGRNPQLMSDSPEGLARLTRCAGWSGLF